MSLQRCSEADIECAEHYDALQLRVYATVSAIQLRARRFAQKYPLQYYFEALGGA